MDGALAPTFMGSLYAAIFVFWFLLLVFVWCGERTERTGENAGEHTGREKGKEGKGKGSERLGGGVGIGVERYL